MKKLYADIRTGVIKIFPLGEKHNCLSGVDGIVTMTGNGEESSPGGYRKITEEQIMYAKLFAKAPAMLAMLERAERTAASYAHLGGSMAELESDINNLINEIGVEVQ